MINSSSFKIFIITSVGLEQIVKQELMIKIPHFLPDLKYKIENIEKGGILVSSDDLDILLLNKILKTPVKILMRVSEFKARDFPKLFNKIKKLSWGQWLFGQEFQVKCSLKNSRLIHSGRAEKTISDGITHWLQGNPRKKTKPEIELPPQIILCRIDNDICTISIDSSGIPLYKRNDRHLAGIAPIRENIASCLYLKLAMELEKHDISPSTLIDPMCGSGTLLSEAKNFWHLNKLRNFSYEFFPAWKPLIDKTDIDKPCSDNFIKNFLGIEKNKSLKESHQQSYGEDIDFIYQNFLELSEIDSTKKAFIINPPYGKRIKIPGSSQKFFQEIIDHFRQSFPSSPFSLIVPDKITLNYPSGFISKTPFSNGGLDVTFVIFIPKINEPVPSH